jgi:3-oxoisoapionate kinase
MNTERSLPDGLLLTYYGDDFTGSTDVMEAFSAAGIETVLFLRPPSRVQMARMSNVKCVGVAGQSRGRSPQWMRAQLPEVFAALAALGAPIVQYKVCSTFDSSPNIGSIGCAVELGIASMPGGAWSPMIVGVPQLGRYQAFGHLFARDQSGVHRLDRHPTMSRHPVTPMTESDLARHLSAQTSHPISVLDYVTLLSEGQAKAYRTPECPIVLIDALNDALVAYWRSRGWIAAQGTLPEAKNAHRLAMVSGSCSPVTAQQIQYAQRHGFTAQRLDISAVLAPERCEAEISRLTHPATRALAAGLSSITYSALGPDDDAVLRFDETARQAGLSRTDAAIKVGQVLADIMRRTLDADPALRRIVVASGDSSGEVANVLGIDALSVIAKLAPGVPLCRAWSENAARDGLEIALKGGQLGGEEFFVKARNGIDHQSVCANS